MARPQDLEKILNSGREALERGAIDRAETALADAQAAAPHDRDVILFGVAVALTNLDDEAAEEGLAALVDHHGDDPVALVAASSLVLDLDGDPEQALELVEEAVEMLDELAEDPEEAELAEHLARRAWPQLSSCRLACDDREGALEAAETATKKFADEVEGWLALGHASFALCRLPEARAAFEKAGALDTENAETPYCIGWITRLMGEAAASEAAFRRAVELAPEDFHVPQVFAAADVQGAVKAALDELDPDLGALAREVPVVVDELPALTRDGDTAPTMLVSFDEAGEGAQRKPTRLHIYKRNVEVAARDLDALVVVLTGAIADELVGFVDVEAL